MKISAVITAAALAFGGAAFAQDGGNGPGQHSMPNDTAATAPHHAKGDGLVAKTKRGFHRMGAKMRHAFHRDHTTAMGASSRDLDKDQARQHRMDEAYANWKAKHEKRS